MKFLKAINTRIFNYAAWISIISIFFKGEIETNSNISMSKYGFPCPFFMRDSVLNGNSKWILSDFNIDFLQLLSDIFIYYFIIIAITKLYKKYFKLHKLHTSNIKS